MKMHTINMDEKFQEYFNLELLKSENVRLIILTIIFALLSVYTFFVTFTVESTLDDGFLFMISGFFVFLLLRATVVRYFFNKKLKRKESVPYRIIVGNALFEVSIPTASIFMFSLFYPSINVLLTPATLLYTVFILLTTLELDYKISLLSGFAAGLEYLLISIYVISISQNKIPYFDNPMFYLGKSIIMVFSGAIAGFIGQQIKRRMVKLHMILEEKNKIQNMFGQQVSPAIVDELLKSEDGLISKHKKVAVMFMDVRNFSKYAFDKEPEEIIRYQNNLFSFMIDIVNKHNGIVNQIMGDGLMVTFGAPVSIGNDCRNAVDCGMEILETLKQKNNSGEIPKTSIGIGIHTGDVVTGNVGTAERKQYSITGNVVILASRIEQLNKEYNSSMLISKEVLKEVYLPNRKIENLGSVTVKGSDEPIEIFKLA